MLKRFAVPALLVGLVLGCGSGSEASPRCGDAIVQDDELCDDGNRVEGDGCNTDCRVSGSLQWCFGVEAPEGSTGEPTTSIAFEGGVLVAGMRDDAEDSDRQLGWLVALSSTGEQLWEREIDFPGISTFRPRSFVAGPSGSTVLLAGSVALEPFLDDEAWIGEIDLASGELIRKRRYADDTASLGMNSIIRTEDGLVVAGRASPDAWIAKLDADWSIEWERRFNYEGGPDRVTRAVLLANGELAVVGVARSTIDSDDQPPYHYVFYRVYDSNGNLEVDLTPAGTSPQRTRTGGTVTWNDGVLVAHRESSWFGSHLWLFGAKGQTTEPWDLRDESRTISSLAASPKAVFAAGYRRDPENKTGRWLARLEPDLTSFAWEYVGLSGTVNSLATALNEPAVYASVVIWRPEGGADTDICKFSE